MADPTRGRRRCRPVTALTAFVVVAVVAVASGVGHDVVNRSSVAVAAPVDAATDSSTVRHGDSFRSPLTPRPPSAVSPRLASKLPPKLSPTSPAPPPSSSYGSIWLRYGPGSVRDLLAATCPKTLKGRVLFNGATLDLCARSVHDAATDTAAAVVAAGFRLLGLPYSLRNRDAAGYADCSSFVTKAFAAAGRPIVARGSRSPSTSRLRNPVWADTVTTARAGDLLWRRGHVMIALADGYMMHASDYGTVTHVAYPTRYSRILRVDPDRLPQPTSTARSTLQPLLVGPIMTPI